MILQARYPDLLYLAIIQKVGITLSCLLYHLPVLIRILSKGDQDVSRSI